MEFAKYRHISAAGVAGIRQQYSTLQRALIIHNNAVSLLYTSPYYTAIDRLINYKFQR